MAKMRRVQKTVHPDLFQEHAPGGPLSPLRADNPPGVYTIQEDVTGSKGRIYARAGDQVKIVADHMNVLIVENIETGERLSIKTEKLKT
jgi:hypothetical protein